MDISGRRLSRLMLLALVALLLPACADGSSPDSEEQGAQEPAGEPVIVGFINLEGAPVASSPALREGSEAARKYINAELDGLDGRPLEFEVCASNGTPEASTACANKMVERKVVAVLGGVDLGSAASLPILTGAGIPYIGMTPLLPADLTTEGAFTLDPGGLGTAANAAFAAEKLGAKRVAVLHDDSAQGKQLAEAFVRPALVGKGLQPGNITLVAEKQDAADLAPMVASAARSNPDAVIVVFPPPACARIMQAAKALDLQADMLYIGRCSDPGVFKAGGPGAENAYFFSSVLRPEAHPSDPDVRVYEANIKRFAPDADAGSYDIARGFATTMTFYRRLADLDPGDITASAVTNAFKTAVDAPAFMGHPYTCDGKQAIPAFVSVCNTHVRIYQFAEGRYSDVAGDWISAGAALAP